MAAIIQDSRILTKRSAITSTVPTVPASADHTDGTWLETDIYKGELYMNLVDEKVWTRFDSGIVQLFGAGSIFDDFVRKDGTTNLTGDWATGGFDIQFSNGNGIDSEISATLLHIGTTYATDIMIGINSGLVTASGSYAKFTQTLGLELGYVNDVAYPNTSILELSESFWGLTTTSAASFDLYGNGTNISARRNFVFDGTGVAGLRVNNLTTGQRNAAANDGAGHIIWNTTTSAMNYYDGSSWQVFGSGGGSTFADNVFRIQDNSDATKEIAFEASGITTATTRTFTAPDYSGTLSVINAAQRITAANTFDNSMIKMFNPAATFSYTIVSSAIAADRNLTLPLITANDTLAALGLAQTFTAKQTFTAATTEVTALTVLATTYKEALSGSGTTLTLANQFSTLAITPAAISLPAFVAFNTASGSGTSFQLNSSSTHNNGVSASRGGAGIVGTSGAFNGFNVSLTFQPSSGSATFSTYESANVTYSQTSTASGNINIFNAAGTFSSVTGSLRGFRSNIPATASAGAGTMYSNYHEGAAINIFVGATRFGSTTSPTALIHLAAGTATASTAPLKFTSGTNLTTAENGAMEYNGTNLFFTRTGAVRETVICASAVNVVSPTAPDRTITIDIGGTTYYVHAKTTND